MEMARQRAQLSEESIRTKSGVIAQKLGQLEEFQASRNLLFFLSLPKEVQTDEMIQMALDLGKRVYVPLVDADRRRLNISELPGLDIEFEEKRFGIREPGAPHLKMASPRDLDFVLVPGLAFDRQGGRIGYGAGYYDKFLKEVQDHVFRVGVAFDFQALDAIPQTDLDVPVQKILTENSLITC